MVDRNGKVTVARVDGPAADFYQKPAPYIAKAACRSVGPSIFFEDIDNATTEAGRASAIKRAQEVCASCPVRKECGEETENMEGTSSEDYRCGFRAYMTAAQRVSISRRGGLRGRDPMRVVQGWDGKRRIPPVPVEGDKWTRHHTTLARRVVKWVVENVEVGERLPTQADLCEALACKNDPLKRVLQALVQDGTLDFAGRKGRGANANTNRYTRRGAPKRIASWLPLHLRLNPADEGIPCGE